MSVRIVVAGMLLLWSAAATAKDLRSQLDGEWKLVSSEQVLADGIKGPTPFYGEGRVGGLVFTTDGDMCAIVFAQSMNAYCGKYELNEGDRSVVFDVAIDGVPNDMGDKLKRELSFDGGKMKLRSVKPRDGVHEYTLTFKRM
jgi:hypothetical protein